MSDAGRWCLPDPARKAHWIAMSSNSYGDGSTRGFDKLPPDLYQPDPELAGYPPPQPAPSMGPIGYGQPGPGQSYGQLGPYGPAVYPPPMPVPTSALPDVPRPYQQMLRGRKYRWWKPLLCLALVIPLALFMMGLAIVPVLIAGLVTGAPDLVEYATRATTDIANMGPVGFFYLNLTLIVLIPASGLSIWIVHGIRPRFLSSVVGGIRWKWLLRCVAVILPLWALYAGLAALSGPPTSPRPDQWAALLVIVLVMTPLQAAGEEYFFRGWIMQNVGAWFARPMVGLVVSLIVSAVAFSTAHLSPDPWILGTIACIGLAAGIATWRTGGLEAAIAIHAVNNVLSYAAVMIFGGWSQAFVRPQSTGTPMMLVLAAAVSGIALALVLWQAKRAGVQRYYQPPTAPLSPRTVPPAPAYPLSQYPAP
ncbi:MAG TPA: CPBP family glutamic-type intramembrane protease [Propionibacteriaceae bacterium]|nr:CPBP family glutamic-type intramembrane protease [Propionibacteriaceae bacterium]